jgi:hypothetical protein
VTPEQVAAAVKDQDTALGGGWMLSQQARPVGKELGTGSWGLYMIGRAGVLGDVDPAVVVAALGFFPEERVRYGWERARAAVDLQVGHERYIGVMRQWARDHVRGADGLDRLGELLERVVAAAPSAGLPIFAGWAALPLPDDPAERVVQLSMALREHRGGCHLIAVTAHGLTPLEAVLAGGGPGNAEFFGWPEPYPDVTDKKALRDDAEILTDRLAARAWRALDEAESAECVGLVRSAAAHTLAAVAAATAG